MITIAFAAALAFNLNCEGLRETGSFNALTGEVRRQQTRPLSAYTLRVDIASGRWCDQDCATTSPFHSVSDEEIVFSQQAGAMLKPTPRFMVNRTTGDLSYLRRDAMNGTYEAWTAKCEPTDFSGFPKKKF